MSWSRSRTTDANAVLSFYDSDSNEQFRWNSTLNQFELTKKIAVTGEITGSSNVTATFDLAAGRDVYVNFDGADGEDAVVWFQDNK